MVVMAKTGRPPKFKTPEELQDKYLAWREEFNTGKLVTEIPDVEGFCDYVGMWRDKFSEYGNKPEFHDTIKEIKNWIYYRKKQLAMSGRMNATVFIFDAKNNAGYVDKMEQDITSNGESLSPVLVKFIGQEPRDTTTSTDN